MEGEHAQMWQNDKFKFQTVANTKANGTSLGNPKKNPKPAPKKNPKTISHPKESQQDTKEIKTVKVETKEEQKVMGKARTRAEESKTQANRMRKASIARFAVQRKVKTTVQKIVSSTPGRTRKVIAPER